MGAIVHRHRLTTLALFGLLAVLHSWPLASDLAHLSRLDNDDAALNTWIVAWTAHILSLAPWRLFEAPIFYPEAHTLAYADHLFVPSLIGAPLLWLGGSPVLVHNVLIILGLALSGFAMSQVIRQWTGSRNLRDPVGFTYFSGIPAVYDRLAASAPVVLAEFPFYSGPRANGNGPYVLNNTRYFQPLINGYSGFEPRTYSERAQRLETFPSTEALTTLKVLGVTHVTVHVAAFAQRSGAGALDAVGQRPELQLMIEEDGIRLYQVRDDHE